MNKCILTLIAMLGPAGLTVCSPGRSSLVAAAEPSTTQTAGDDLLQRDAFKDPKSGIEIRLPKGWVPKKGIQDTGFEAPAKDRDKFGGLAPNVVLAGSAAKGIKPSDLDVVIAGKRKQYAKIFAGYQDEAAGTSVPSIAGKGVGRIDCTSIASKVLRIHHTQIWIIANDQIYVITYASLSDTHAGYAGIFDAMIKTIAVP